MKEEIRRAIVSTAALKINGHAPSSIFSYERSQHSSMSEGYDYEAGAHFSNSFHHGTGSHFNLSVEGKDFKGFDYGEGHHFSGSVNGNAVTLYDYGEGQYFQYAV